MKNSLKVLAIWIPCIAALTFLGRWATGLEQGVSLSIATAIVALGSLAQSLIVARDDARIRLTIGDKNIELAARDSAESIRLKLTSELLRPAEKVNG